MAFTQKLVFCFFFSFFWQWNRPLQRSVIQRVANNDKLVFIGLICNIYPLDKVSYLSTALKSIPWVFLMLGGFFFLGHGVCIAGRKKKKKREYELTGREKCREHLLKKKIIDCISMKMFLEMKTMLNPPLKTMIQSTSVQTVAWET